jgi:hypothetical protein
VLGRGSSLVLTVALSRVGAGAGEGDVTTGGVTRGSGLGAGAGAGGGGEAHALSARMNAVATPSSARGSGIAPSCPVGMMPRSLYEIVGMKNG